MMMNQPIMKPDHVEGIVGRQEREPDQYFYLIHDLGVMDNIWQADGFKVEDGQTGETHWSILFACPRCHAILRLDSAKKDFVVLDDGRIQTNEAMRCPNEKHEFGPCGWRGHFDAPKKPTAIEGELPNGVKAKLPIHAVIKDAR